MGILKLITAFSMRSGVKCIELKFPNHAKKLRQNGMIFQRKVLQNILSFGSVAEAYDLITLGLRAKISVLFSFQTNFTMYSLHVHHMFTIYSPYVH